MERHQLFLLCRFPDTTLSDPDVAASHRYHTAIPDVFHSLPPTCHTGLLHEPTQEKYNNVCEYPCPMPDTAMEHVHHLLKFVQHLMNNLSCSSLETAVYSCGGRVPLVFGGHLLQEEWVSPGWRGHSFPNVEPCLLLSPSQDNLNSWFRDRPENTAVHYLSAKTYGSSPASAESICTPERLFYICSANWVHLQILFLQHILLSCRSWANEIKNSDKSRFYL